MPGTTKFVLVGRVAMVREGLRRILTEEGLLVEGSFDHPSQVQLQPDDRAQIILIDAEEFPNSVDIVRDLHERFPAARLVALCDGLDLPLLVKWFRCGLSGYIVKEISCEPLLASLRLVAMGEKVLPSRLADELDQLTSRADADGDDAQDSHLSDREAEILKELVLGRPNKIISRNLSISEATVKVHVKAVLRKLQVRNRTQAAIWAVNHGFTIPDSKPAPQPSDVQQPLFTTAAGIRPAPPERVGPPILTL